MRIAWAFPLLLLIQDEPFRKLFEWESKNAPARHRATLDVGRWMMTEEALKKIEPPAPRELVKISAKDGILRCEDKSGVREFRLQEADGKIASITFEGLPWPPVNGAKPAEVTEKDLDRSEPKKAAISFLKLRGEVNRRLREPLADLAKILPLEDPPEPAVLSQDVDRRFALVYVALTLRGAPDPWAVRLRLKRGSDGWRIDEEGIYCPDCPEHAACKSCQGRGIMIIGDNEKAMCIGCRPSGDCRTCGGTGYRSKFSLLQQ